MKLSWRHAGIAAALVGALSLSLAGCGSSGPSSSGSSSPSSPSSSTGPVALSETGSSLLYPLFNIWVPDYSKTHNNIKITTDSTGSGTGIADASNGTAQIGASDAYMSDAQLAKVPGILNIPLTISAQQINYNVPGLSASQHLNLSGPVLAGIYTGKIQYWDDSAIKAINSGVNLPHLRIVPIHRSDGSGDTFIFTQYLSFSNPSTWGASSGPQYGTTVSWPPVQGSESANGNPGMVQSLAQTKGGIAYIGVSFLDQTVQKGLGYAALGNKAGQFVLPTQANIQAAAAALVPNTPPDERISLIYAPGANSYPIINYEYAIVNDKQSSADVAKALTTFLNWAVTSGNADSYLSQVHFLPLPSGTVSLSKAQIAKIH